MDKNTISVTLGGDHGYFIGIYVTAHSICRSARPGVSITLHIFDAGLDDEDRRLLQSLEGAFTDRTVRVHLFKPDLSPFMSLPKFHGSHATFARLLLQDLLTDDDWTIYTDVDVLWLRDVGELWAQRDPAHALMAAPDGSGFAAFSQGAELAQTRYPEVDGKAPERYFGAGILLLNLKKLRDIGFARQVMELVPRVGDRFKYSDQDFYNFLLPCPEASLVDPRWNTFACHWGTYGIDGQVIHYAGWVPWRNPKMRRVIMVWWEYLAEAIGWERLGARGDEYRQAFARAQAEYRALSNPITLALLRIFRPKLWRKRMLRIVPSPYDPKTNDWRLPESAA